MPSPRFFGFPTCHPSFQKHRFEDNSQHPPLKIDISIPTPLPAWASLPTPPMSGTPPPETSTDLPQLAGRRRKREDTPPTTNSEFLPQISNSINVSPLVEQTATRYGEPSRTTRTTEQVMLPPPGLLPWEQNPSYVAGGGQGFALVTANMPSRAAQASPRATRKVKAHVASACVNCKRKHLRCDETRPCRRCVQSGKEDTCVDVEHKKRGRPPLRSPGRDGAQPRHGGISLPPIGTSTGRVGPPPNLPPLLPTPNPSRVPFPTSYAPPSIAPSPVFAQGQFSSSLRPLSFPHFQQHLSGAPQAAVTQSMPVYPYQGSDQVGAMYPSAGYPTPIFARRPVPSQSAVPSEPASYNTAPLQLPPIRPAPPNTTMDPAIAQQQRHLQPQSTNYGQMPPPRVPTGRPPSTMEERDPKRPKMDMSNILSPCD